MRLDQGQKNDCQNAPCPSDIVSEWGARNLGMPGDIISVHLGAIIGIRSRTIFGVEELPDEALGLRAALQVSMTPGRVIGLDK
ncbi:hypothetical protein [Bradyrhizobium iriomotense]|uniref:hypothetical protein n=1 Tax=Bradyrhizobium iriomotense TaxID=441950 RepID=UPI001B89DA63|nr:hypothetical protein [Bradyrhizobium iriomotense]MBR1130797.1 hypothetical protein [Bradyrhizobium iriomotense]